MAAWNADRTDLRSHASTLAIESSTALTSRFGSVTERVPLFDAGPLAARTGIPQPVPTIDRGRP
jgi:hypothetical protein